MTDQRTELLREVALGIEAEEFLDGSVGKYLVAKAEAEIAEAVAAIKIVDPNNSALIREIQNQIYRAESIQLWLAEGIQSGWNAETVIKQMDEGT